MFEVPQQDWSYYAARTQASDAQWLRSLTPDERYAQYDDLFNIVWAARREVPGNWARLEQWQWQEKLALRHRMIDAFTKLDELRRERAAANHAG